ncbi:helix-turn-helix domain-containing protein [Carnobacterium funditum]|uniref:helix-turn-helix domain-containing protein n=1 Tax=Carnobacterium funditum TaxID=2752 RepID=UPI0005581CFC|nr:helix-turn-helix transcriptional regulator [Carnobacterium funditum]
MKELTFLYNIILIVLYSISLTSISAIYIKTKKPIYLYTAIMFLLFIFDNTVIYMTEFLSGFGHSYNMQFMDVPAFKTIIVLGTAFSYYIINYYILQLKRNYIDSFILIAYAVYLLFIPMMNDNALKVWLYYLPAQLYLAYLASTGLYHVKKYPVLYKDSFFNRYTKLLKISLWFSLFILIEDTIVIFNFDIYSTLLLKINNRNIGEDILSIIYSIAAIKHTSNYLNNSSFNLETKHTFPTLRENNTIPEISYTPVSSNTHNIFLPNHDKEELSTNEEEFEQANNTFNSFCQTYHLTTREQDIFHEILADKSNDEISAILFISIGTVKTHMHNIYQKVHVNKRTHLLHAYHAYHEK